MKTGQVVEVLGFTMTGAETGERAKVLRWVKKYGPRENIPGYWPVQFDSDGAVLMVHQERMRVVA